jgi:hypothetical protein
MNVNEWHPNAVYRTFIFLPQRTSYSFYRYLILQIQVQFDYEISLYTGWESLQ